MELDHEDLLPLCMFSVTLFAGPFFFSREGVRRDTAPGSRFLQSLHHKCSSVGLRAKENHLPCLSSSRGTCTCVCVCGVRPGLVGWGGEGGKQDRPWVGCKSSPERGCRLYHLWGKPMSKSITDHMAPSSSCLCLALRSSQPHPYPSNRSTRSSHLTVEDGSLEAQLSSREADIAILKWQPF